MRLQAQEKGSGAQAFEFLENKAKKVNSVDPGFTDGQLLIVDDLTWVRLDEICRFTTAASCV